MADSMTEGGVPGPATAGVTVAGVTVTAAAGAGAMPPDFGAALRAAREAAGIPVSAVAARMRLHVKQIEALERCDLKALPSLIYVRGFIRSFARDLKIDPLPLLADLDRRAGVASAAPLPPGGDSFRFARLGDSSRAVVALIVFGLVVAGVIGTLIPRRASVNAVPAAPALVVPAPIAPLPPAPAQAPPASEAPASGGAGAAVATAPVATSAGLAASGAPARMADAEPAERHASKPTATPGVTPATAPAAAPAATAAASPALSPAASPAVSQAAAAATEVHTRTLPRAAELAPLVLKIRSAAWVEVVQGNGITLISQVCGPGTVQTVKGTPPLHVVVGNSAAVEAEFRGAPVNLARYASENGVARLTLE
jgi:cytoskeleton protein RodZ